MEKQLNPDQQKVVDGCLNFLLDPSEKYMEVDGPAGTGKTFLQGQIIDEVIPMYENTCRLLDMDSKYDEVHMTATTNKAAEQLSLASGRPTGTIHSLLGLMVKDDLRTGESSLSRRRGIPLVENKVIFIDEKSFIGTKQLKGMINDYTINCKIILFGDDYQLSPPKDTMAKWDTPFKFGLNIPVRNANQPALRDLCNQLRETVRTGIFKPIQLVPGVIDCIRGDEMVKEVRKAFLDEPIPTRFLAYSNNMVNTYNRYIRSDLRKMPDLFTDGEVLVVNSAFTNGDVGFSTEEEVELSNVSHTITRDIFDDGAALEVYKATITSKFAMATVKIPVDRDHLNSLKKYYAGKKLWKEYFELRDGYPDLRPKDASTVHKAQGSTVDTIFIDLNDLGSCNVPDTVARLLYVGCSRAQNRIIFYGDLPEKYGGLR